MADQESEYEKTLKDLLKSLMNENIKMSVQLKTLALIVKATYQELETFHNKQGVSIEKFDDLYKKARDISYQDTVASHAHLDQQWKEQLKKDLNDISGLDLS